MRHLLISILSLAFCASISHAAQEVDVDGKKIVHFENETIQSILEINKSKEGNAAKIEKLRAILTQVAEDTSATSFCTLAKKNYGSSAEKCKRALTISDFVDQLTDEELGTLKVNDANRALSGHIYFFLNGF